MTHKNKRSQITLFIIIGLVILMIFGVSIYFVSLTKSSKTKEESQKILTETIQIAGIKAYVEECLDQSIEEGLLLLGKQGGKIYEHQGGNIVLNKFVSIDSSKVSYGIIKPFLSEDSIYPPPWKYPKEGPIQSSGRGYFGENSFPGLCDFNGLNKPGSKLRLPCPTYDLPNENDHSSVQEQLQIFIANKTKSCINFSAIPNINQNIIEGNISSEITMGRSSIDVKLNYPLQFKIAGKEPIVELMEFNSRIQIRLMDMFEIAQDIINKDNNELFFNLKNSKTKLQGYDSFIDINLFKRICNDCGNEKFDTLLIIQDRKSTLNNTPYIIQFMIENRIPVLDWIGNYPKFDGYDMIILEGETINLTVQGYDPDDLDEISYNFKGWKEDYDEIFDYTGFELNPVFPVQYITRINTPLRHWSIDSNYPESFPNASYNTIRNDIGPHNLSIEIKDSGGLIDWQDLNILIADKPIVKAESFKPYEDIPENIASVEDPFQLNGNVFSAFTTILDSFWTDLTTGKIYTNLTQKIPEEDIDIKNIKSTEFNDIGIHNFELTVNTNYVGTIKELLDIDVKECLPHKNPDEIIYPYTSNFINPYYADHTCCKDDYTIDSGKICYEETELSCKPTKSEIGIAKKAIMDDGLNIIDPDVSEYMTIENENNKKSRNDIYERTFTQKCRERGNICSGEIEDVWLIKTDCKDYDETKGETESCQGPVGKPSECNILTETSCYKFQGTTFEKEFQLLNSNDEIALGICNPELKCSDKNDLDSYDKGGNFLCQGTCGNGECNYPINCKCSASCGANANCDDLSPNDNTGKCTGELSWFEDFCTNDCNLQDLPYNIFKCNGEGCLCDTPLCDGHTKDDSLDRCDLGGENYFLDKCNETAGAVDMDNTCTYSPGKGCTSDPSCNGYNPGEILDTCSNTIYLRDICSDSCKVSSIEETYKTIGGGCFGPIECDGLNRFSIVTGVGWCYEESNSLKFCESPFYVIIDANTDGTVDETDICGTCLGRNGLPCDENFDGIFSGTCTFIGTCNEI